MSEKYNDLTPEEAKDIKDINLLVKKSLKNTRLSETEAGEILERLDKDKDKLDVETSNLLKIYLKTFKRELSAELHIKLKTKLGDNSPTYLSSEDIEQENKRVSNPVPKFDKTKLPIEINPEYPLKKSSDLLTHTGKATEIGVDDEGNEWIFQGEHKLGIGWVKGDYYNSKDGTKFSGKFNGSGEFYDGVLTNKDGKIIGKWVKGKRVLLHSAHKDSPKSQKSSPNLTREQAKNIQDINSLVDEALKNKALNNAEAQEIKRRLIKSGDGELVIQSRQELLEVAKRLGWAGLIKIIETKTVQIAKLAPVKPEADQSSAPQSEPQLTEPLLPVQEAPASVPLEPKLETTPEQQKIARESAKELFVNGYNVNSESDYNNFLKAISKTGVKMPAWKDLPDEIKDNKDPKKILTMSFEGDRVNIYFAEKKQSESDGAYVTKFGEINSEGKFEKSGSFGRTIIFDSLENNNVGIIRGKDFIYKGKYILDDKGNPIANGIGKLVDEALTQEGLFENWKIVKGKVTSKDGTLIKDGTFKDGALEEGLLIDKIDGLVFKKTSGSIDRNNPFLKQDNVGGFILDNTGFVLSLGVERLGASGIVTVGDKEYAGKFDDSGSDFIGTNGGKTYRIIFLNGTTPYVELRK